MQFSHPNFALLKDRFLKKNAFKKEQKPVGFSSQNYRLK